jgi:hypothetical protein
MKGYIGKVREDGKIDLRLEKPGFEKLDAISQHILDLLKKNGGFLRVNDNSPAEEIYRIFGTSKKNFKKALGVIYKKRLVLLETNGIRLAEG